MELLRVPIADDAGDEVKRRFSHFLQNFRLDEEIEIVNEDGTFEREIR
jgi:hypothetical protein